MTKAKSRSRKQVLDMRPEYDFTEGVRGKYAVRYLESSRVVVLDPDVARDFPDSESVNRALRALSERARRSKRKRTS